MEVEDFVSIKDRLPEEGQEVEAMRIYGESPVPNHGHRAYGCIAGIERTSFTRGMFVCDMTSTGETTHWRPAAPWPAFRANDYGKLTFTPSELPAPDEDTLDDQEESIPCAELRLLRRIAETSSDVVRARNWEEFRQACGGQDHLEKVHAEAVQQYEQWISEGQEG
jgi:hypothetical protein